MRYLPTQDRGCRRADGEGGVEGRGKEGKELGGYVRVLVDEARGVVDLIVDDDVAILLGGVLRDVRVSEFLVRHCVFCFRLFWFL